MQAFPGNYFRHCAFATVAVTLASSTMAQDAYFSIEGTGDMGRFDLNLANSVGSSQTLRFETFHHSGGVNAAGDTIAAGSFNPGLVLADSTETNVGLNLNGKSVPSMDSLLSWSGVAAQGTFLFLDPLSAGDYALSMFPVSGGGPAVPYAIDLVGPAADMSLNSFDFGLGSNVSSLKFGTDTAGTPATLNSSADFLNISGALVVAQTGEAQLNLNSGTLQVAGTSSVNAGGTVSHTAGSFTALGDLNLDGGNYDLNGGDLNATGAININNGSTFEYASGTFNPGTALNINNGGTFGVSGGTSALSGITVNAGGSINHTAGTLDIDDDILFDGGDLTSTGGGFSLASGKTLTANNNAQVSFSGPLNISSSRSFVVESGADLSTASLDVTGTLTVDGSGSSLATTAGALTANNNADISIRNQATANIAGPLNLGDSFSITSGLNVESGGSLAVSSINMGTGLSDSESVTLTVDGAGSTLTTTDPASALTLGRTVHHSITRVAIQNNGTLTTGTGTTIIRQSAEVHTASGGTLALNGPATNDGIVRNNGSVSGNLTSGSGGLTLGSGTHTGNLTDSGRLSPGDVRPLLDGAAVNADGYVGVAASGQRNTAFGDNTDPSPVTANGSELDDAFARVVGDSLFLTIAGNLETNGNSIELFIDSVAGGQNRLRGDNPNVDSDGLNRMGDDGSGNGLTFDTGFESDYYLTLRHNASDQFQVGFAETLTSGGGTGGIIGTSETDGTYIEASNGIKVAIDNSNLGGVTAGTNGTNPGDNVLTGFEYEIPLSAIGSPTGPIKLTALINGVGHSFLSNQSLQLIGGFSVPTDNFGEPRDLDISAENPIGDQFFSVDVSSPSLAGAYTIDGDWDKTGGSLAIDIGGLAAGTEFDQLVVTGTSTLAGTLEISLFDGFVPNLGDSFEIITTGSLTGTFSSITGTDLGGGLSFDVVYGLDHVTLNVISNSIPGDLDGDGFVGINDLNIVLANWNQNVPPANPLADPSGDGFVGIDDLNEVLGNWNAGTPPNATANIPEPGTLGLLSLAIALIQRRR